jgi:transposase-like protein
VAKSTKSLTSFPGNGKLKQTPEQERIAELERKLKDAELERDILKSNWHLSKTVDDLCFH